VRLYSDLGILKMFADTPQVILEDSFHGTIEQQILVCVLGSGNQRREDAARHPDAGSGIP
jgi:hypothetical protein